MRRIVLLDAPAVLGWPAWREIDTAYGLGLVIEGLNAVMDAGVIERRPVEVLAHLLLGALNEAGHVGRQRRRSACDPWLRR